MPDNLLFEYAILRVVPKVEREEFLNVGVVLFCKSLKLLQTRIRLNENRVLAIDPKADMDEIKSHLAAFEKIARGAPDSGKIGQLPVDERFRWLTGTRSTIVQTSKVHPGFCIDPKEMLERLFEKMVG